MSGDFADCYDRDDGHSVTGRPRNGFGWQLAPSQLFGDVIVVAFDPIEEQHQPGHGQQQQPGALGDLLAKSTTPATAVGTAPVPLSAALSRGA